jgi:tetratricopeptide (TPR) repeat protein
LSSHPNRTTLERFLLGSLPAAELPTVIGHLIAGCARCRKVLAPLAAVVLPKHLGGNRRAPQEKTLDFSEHTYDRAFARAEAKALAWGIAIERERQEAPGKIHEILAQQTADGRGLALRREPGFWTLGVVEELLARSRELRHENPPATIQYALLAKLAAEHLDSERYGAERVQDTLARSWAELGNAYRIADELEQADAAFSQAEVHKKSGSGDPFLAASIADLMASLRCDQRRFSDAFNLLDASYALYVDHGDRHCGGRTLLKKGIYIGYAGEPEEALRLLSRGLLMIDRRREPALLAQATHAYLWFKVDLGEYTIAPSLLGQLRWLYKQHGGKIDFLKLRWLEGRIAAGNGKLTQAAVALEEVHAGMTQAGLQYNGALAGLDLAAVWFRQGRIGQIPRLVDEILAAFRERRIAREAIAAILLVRDAYRQQSLSVDLIQRVSQILTQLERFGLHGPEEPVGG